MHIDSEWCTCQSCQTQRIVELIDGMPTFFQWLLWPGALGAASGLVGFAAFFIFLVLELGWKYPILEQGTIRWLAEKSILIGISGLAWVLAVIILYTAYEAMAAVGRLMYRVIRWIIS